MRQSVGEEIGRPVAQFATFPIPQGIGDFGGNTDTNLGPSDIFAVLFEYGPESVGKALFLFEGIPSGLSTKDFLPYIVRPGIGGSLGIQRFFTVSGRPFMFYARLGSLEQQAILVQRVNQLLANVTIEPLSASAATRGAAHETPPTRRRPRPVPRRFRRPRQPPPRRRDRSLSHCVLPACPGRCGQDHPTRQHRARPVGAAIGSRHVGSGSRCPSLRPPSWPSGSSVPLAGPRPRHGDRGRLFVFAGFVVLISMRHGALSSCGCFGTPDTPATWLHAAINMFLAASALVVALDRPGADIVSVLRAQPWRGIPMLAAVGVGTWLVVLAFSTMAQLSRGPPHLGAACGRITSMTVVERASMFLERRLSRRSFINRSAFVGSAVVAGSGVDLMLSQGPPTAPCENYAGSDVCDCGSTCCSGYSEFCCTINGGYNYCPTGTIMAGWWKADNSSYCGGPRYYMDCNALCGCGCPSGSGFCAPGCDGVNCGCALGNCNNFVSGCFQFRYGQCNQDVGCRRRDRLPGCRLRRTLDGRSDLHDGQRG